MKKYKYMQEFSRKLDDLDNGYSRMQRVFGAVAFVAATLGGLDLALEHEIPQNIMHKIGEVFNKDMQMYEGDQ